MGGCYGSTVNEEVEKSEVRGKTRGGDGDTRAGRRVLSGGNLNLQDRQGGNGAQSCLAGGAMRRLGQGSARKHRGPCGPSWPRGWACRLCGLQGFWGQVRVYLHAYTVPAWGLRVIAPPAALPLWKRTRAHREEAPSGPTTRSLLPPSLLPSSSPPTSFLASWDAVVLCMWPERDQQ